MFLTNALTGWDEETGKEPKQLQMFMPELMEERDRADQVKRDTPVLVILGNPPYNGLAGMAVGEEEELKQAYKTTKQVKKPEGQGLNDLYVRFFRMAERRIAEKTGRGVAASSPTTRGWTGCLHRNARAVSGGLRRYPHR